MDNKPRAAHIAVPYLRPTETFIYDRISHHSRYAAFVLTDEKAINLDLFPFPYVHSLANETPLTRAASKAARRITGRLPFFENKIRKLRPSVIHAHYGPVGVAALPLRKLTGIPLITSFYGIDASAFVSSSEHEQGYSALWRECDAISVLSEDMKEAITHAGCPREKILVHHLAVDTSSLIPVAQTCPPPPPLRIICAARLVEKKGIVVLLKAVAEATRMGIDIELDIAGTGSLEFQIRQQAENIGIAKYVRFHGLTTRDNTLSLMRRAHFFMLLSQTAADGDSEGTPTVLIEAGALGLPAISTFHAGIPEVITNGKTGILVPEGDFKSAADAIAKLAVDSELRAALGAAAREKIQCEFSINKVIEQIENDYDKLATNTGRNSL